MQILFGFDGQGTRRGCVAAQHIQSNFAKLRKKAALIALKFDENVVYQKPFYVSFSKFLQSRRLNATGNYSTIFSPRMQYKPF